MPWSPALTKLRKALSALYGTKEDARRVAVQAGLDLSLVNLNSKSSETWQSILEEAEHHGKVGDIITEALKEYANNPYLERAIAEYRSITTSQNAKEIPPPSRVKGPGYVEFVIVAGRASELGAIRAMVDSYGDECWHWRPYHPDSDKRVGPLIQSIASSEDFDSGLFQLAPDWTSRLDQAEKENSIIVIVVDPWTVRLAQYNSFMGEYDKRSYLNCAVLIPWNKRDNETAQNRDKLMTALQATFKSKMIVKDPKSFKEEIVSPEHLDAELRDVLMEIRRRILETGKVVRKAESEHIIVLPQIVGPGGI